MKTEYKRDLQNNYLVLEVAEPDAEDGYGLRMAEQNHVKGLLPMHECRRDGKMYLHYEITSKQSLESLYEKKLMGYQDILYVLSGIRDTLEDMRKYLLSPQKLLFSPEMIYVLPERGGLLLCYYVKEDECPITMLAEFILKRLDHKDRQAVTLGYGFFQQASGANFSLAKTLKEILAVSGEAGRQAAARAGANAGIPKIAGGAQTTHVEENAGIGGAQTARAEGDAGAPGALGGSELYREEMKFRGKEWMQEESVEELYEDAYREDPPVIHRERKRKREEKESFVDRVFSVVHPAILLSFLALLVVLELLIVFGVLGLTEAGGCFFLILSVEILVNRKVLNKKKNDREEWQEDEENEEYQRVLQEMYRNEVAPEPEPVEETRCLLQEEETDEICLIYQPGKNSERTTWPDIFLGPDPIYVGKIKGEADIILASSTVSRMHARLEVRDGRCFLRDMNSKNGTFVNGKRLMPQEESELQEKDIIAFAEITYCVAKRRVYY